MKLNMSQLIWFLLCGVQGFAENGDKTEETYFKVAKCINKNPFLKELKNDFHYPDDAEAHFADIYKKTEKYRDLPIHRAAGYGGPWIENHWISHFRNRKLSYFNGLIPIFVQWVDIHAHIFLGRHNRTYYNELYDGLASTFSSLLRPDVLYVTVSQDDEGISNRYNTGTFHSCPNILTLSAGGFGHIPIPLVKDEIAWNAWSGKQKWTAGFFGAHGSNITRTHLLDEISSNFKKHGVQYNEGYTTPNELDWHRDMSDTLFNMAPQGFGRTSYRLSEIIQAGRLPVYLYGDEAWIPYANSSFSVTSFGFVATFGSTEEVVLAIKNISSEEIQHRLQLMQNARPLYTYAGILNQLELFFGDPLGPTGGLLSCSPVPKTVLVVPS